MFLKERQIKELPFYTPSKWQTVILKNYGLVPNENLAHVLKCSVKRIELEARRLGIDYIEYDANYYEKSYLTIIRNNWHLLNYEQLLILLNKDESWLDNELKNNDFLWVKLGGYKPACETIHYNKLSKEQIKETNKIRRLVLKNKIEQYAKPFDFKPIKLDGRMSSNYRIAYPYSTTCGDLFINEMELISDDDFAIIQSSGINALWVHGLLSELSFNKFLKNNDSHYQERRKNLKTFINRAKRYGIKVFLYLNEPRAISIDNIKEEYKYLIGRIENDFAALCFSFKEIKDYLYEATLDLLKDIPDLGGFITITASENLTYCKHTLGSTCPHCKDIKPYQTAAEINNIIQKAIDDSNSQSILIANLWGWAPYCGFEKDDVQKGIKLLDKKIDILCVSEFGTHMKKNQEYQIDEYSISHGEPCLETIGHLKYAKRLGHKIFAKIQINNSWEISTIPYIPVFELIINHINKLRHLGVDDLMISWTLGGYPSVIANMVSCLNDNFDYDKWLSSIYKQDKDIIKKSVHYFSKAFKLYPFSQSILYKSPVHLGPANMLYEKETGLESTMVTFPFDDVNGWLGSQNKEAFIQDMTSMIKIWRKGIKELDKLSSNNALSLEIWRYSAVFLINMESTLNQIKFNDNRPSKKIIDSEMKLTKALYRLASQDAKIGFEASNQYVFTQNTFIEKLLNLYILKIRNRI